MLARPAAARNGERTIQEGDTVIVYERHDRMKAVTVRKGAELQNRYGMFAHSEWIGKPFGCRVCGKSKSGTGFVYLLAPTPELWTCVLSHRTQILYVADISFIIFYLEIKPGSVVLESGTGSGSLTTSFARSVAPSGHVYTFDFHEQRADSAREDFRKNGLSDLITVEVRDIQGRGFTEEHAGKIDAVFLDLPQPWLAISSASKMLHDYGVLCSFSPCIEQAQRTCEALSTQHFTDVRTFEVLLRMYEVKQENLIHLKEGNNADVATALPPRKKVCPAAVQEENNRGPNDTLFKQDNKKGSGYIMAKPVLEARGHTGFLTFAVRTT